jgi:DNA-binding transcriptional LysR family regulator
MDKLGHMRALVTVAKLGSFSAAARELAVTPGMLSKQVKHLEQDLDVRLLHRTTRGVSLTDAGELYVEQAIDILQRIEETEMAVTALNAVPRGVLRISSPPAFGTHVLTPVIAAFVRDNPAIRIELGLQDDEPDVVASRLDLVFRLGALKDSSLVSRYVGNAPFVLCAAPAYLERHGRPAALADLARLNCIIDASVQRHDRWDFVADGLPVAQVVTGNFWSLSTEAVIEAAAAGLGVTYVPRYAVADAIERGEVIGIELAGVAAISLPVHALYSSRRHLAAKTTRFLEYFARHAGATSDTQRVNGRVLT